MTAAKADQPRSGRQRVVALHAQDTVSSDDFRAAFRQHAAGVAVVTADAGAGPVGLTATSVVSVSADPPLLIFTLSAASRSASEIVRSDTAVVHLLGAKQVGLARLCSAAGADRFSDTSMWARLATGEPYFIQANARIRARIVSTMEAGASIVLALQALEIWVADHSGKNEASGPLVYHNRRWHVLGEKSLLAD